MLALLDMRTVLAVGALICFTLAAVMVYHSLARRTYPGFHHWTIGFVSAGAGAFLIAFRGIVPGFLSVVLANFLILFMPYMLMRGLAIFLGIERRRRAPHAVAFGTFLGVYLWATYISPSLYIRVACFSLFFALFFAEALWIAARHIPRKLGEQNWLFITMISLIAVASLFRFVISISQGGSLTFLCNAGAWQCLMILLTILGMVGIMTSLVILNAHRMEFDLKQANKRIENLANQDGLTGLFNRRYFDEKLEREFKRLQRSSLPLSLIMADIDCFKNYNDTYGHQAGDDCIKAVAEAFRQAGGRSSDVSARYGGEEFVMILPDTDSSGARNVAETLSNLVREKAIPHASSIAADTVTLSIGVATVVPERSVEPGMLVALADRALYECKSGGRNRIRCHDKEASAVCALRSVPPAE